MAEQAKVSSIDAIEAFRSALLIYASKMKPLLDASDEVGVQDANSRCRREKPRHKQWHGDGTGGRGLEKRAARERA